MPTYDYRCEKCENVFEEFHGMTEDPEIKCPLCGNVSKKMIGGGLGIIFKGSGFYVTDNKTASNSSGSTGKTSSELNPAKASETKEPASTSSVTAEKKTPVKSSAS
ncbi:MAG: zinc ribbon domain-containing protein [Spirochaetales bacterium]|nr:zinc ribbon domain-containing protein [Spirochaetales bacterium]